MSTAEREVASSATPLNGGELHVLQLLETLDAGWRIDVQPRFGMDQPDFLVTHPQYGACAIEVRDWPAGTCRQAPNGMIEVLSDGEWHVTAEAPRYEAHRCRTTIFERFFAQPNSPHADAALVRAVVIFVRLSTEDARRLQQLPQVSAPAERRIEVWGGDALQTDLLRVVTGLERPRPQTVSADSFHRLMSFLDAGDDVDRRPLVLSQAAMNVEANPNGARIRRVRGAAGSGKSVGLVARAARLAAEGKSVVVVTYNPTLPHYLHEIAAKRCRQIGADVHRIAFVHLDELCKRAVDDALLVGLKPVYPDRSGAAEAHELSVELAKFIYKHGLGQRFDAVLVDEGQDFNVTWWNFLRNHVCRPGGEMLLVADPTQDIYERRAWTDEPQMPGAGFHGPWTELKGTYRMPPDLVPIAAAFAREHLKGQSDEPAVPDDHPLLESDYQPTVRRWLNVRFDEPLGIHIGREVLRLLTTHHDLEPTDIVFLAPSHKVGLAAAEVIGNAGYVVNHLFGLAPSEQTRRSDRFWPRAAGVKGCTPQSYKGWESRAVVLTVDRNDFSHRLAYVGMTRVTCDPQRRSAYLTVINSDGALRSFQPTFEA